MVGVDDYGFRQVFITGSQTERNNADPMTSAQVGADTVQRTKAQTRSDVILWKSHWQELLIPKVSVCIQVDLTSVHRWLNPNLELVR